MRGNHTGLLFVDKTVELFGRNLFKQCDTISLKENNKLIKYISCGYDHTGVVYENNTVKLIG